MLQNICWANGFKKCKGKADLIRFYSGERLIQRQAIAAFCCTCSSGYDTGFGCNASDCPLLHFNPYILAKSKVISAKLGDVCE